jgi:hypothetical protein
MEIDIIFDTEVKDMVDIPTTFLETGHIKEGNPPDVATCRRQPIRQGLIP